MINNFLALDTIRQKLGFHLASLCHCRASPDSNHKFLQYPLAHDLWRMEAIYFGFSNIPWATFHTLEIVFLFCGFVGRISGFSLLNFCLLLFVGVFRLLGASFSPTEFPLWWALLFKGF